MTTTNKIEPPGLLPRDAARAFLDPGLIREIDEAYQAWNQHGRPGKRGTINSEWFPLSYEDHFNNDLVYRKDDAQAHVVSAFYQHLLDGSLIGIARRGDPLGPWAEFPADAWSVMRIFNWEIGLVKDRTGGEYYSLHVARPDEVLEWRRACTLQLPTPKSDQEFQKTWRRRGYAEQDAPLVEEGVSMVRSEGISPWQAAGLLVPKAQGGGVFESTQKRLAGKIKQVLRDTQS